VFSVLGDVKTKKKKRGGNITVMLTNILDYLLIILDYQQHGGG